MRISVFDVQAWTAFLDLLVVAVQFEDDLILFN